MPSLQKRLTVYVIGIGLCLLLSVTFFNSLWGIVLTLPVGLFIVRMLFKRLAEKTKHQLELEFKDAMITVATSLQTGYALNQSFEEAWRVSETIYGKESLSASLFGPLIMGQRMNIPVEQLLEDMEKRSGLDVVKEFVEVIKVTRKYGGNLPELIQKQTRITEDRLIMKAELLSTTAALRYEAYIMDLIPIGIIWYLNLSGAGSIPLLYQTLFGYVFMGICLYVYLAAVLWQFHIMEKSIL